MKKSLIWTLAGVTAVGLVATGASVWALSTGLPAPVSTPPASVAEVPQTAPVEGMVLDSGVPALYTGDELQWLLLSEQGFADVLGIDSVAEVSAAYGAIGESDGVTTDPEQCIGLIVEYYNGSVGFRARWASQDAAIHGRMDVTQFATPEAASAWAGNQLGLLDGCSQFTIGSYGESEPYASRDLSVLADTDDGLSHVVVYASRGTGSINPTRCRQWSCTGTP
ncbi:hypothetical protein [Microbacterium suwonense]|uniref:PknH-like extracellular domain-containing protein n=1 Tax=Microbacterium suwonense TaxID=683047 RepID=A0ABM8FVF4_9MICO|nr:hypothetical protein [Microbacterium suwonense]BDZ39621.1 hypothetical protein GCM10025863_22350 [Microbacterium suwonense]